MCIAANENPVLCNISIPFSLVLVFTVAEDIKMVTVNCNTITSKFINNDDAISQKVKNIYSHLENTDNENHATSDNMSLKDKAESGSRREKTEQMQKLVPTVRTYKL